MSPINNKNLHYSQGIKCHLYHPPKAPSIKEVRWLNPPVGWVKGNSDGAAKGFSGHAGCGVISAMEVAHEKDWARFGLECDSSMVIQAYSNANIVPWKLRTYWDNFLYHMNTLHFRLNNIGNK